MLKDFVFTFSSPYFSDSQDKFGPNRMRIFFKYTNDNNPFQEAYISPLTVIDGLTKIGGLFIIIKLLDTVLGSYNQRAFEKSLQTKYKQLAADHKEGKEIGFEALQKIRDPEGINNETIKESLSYELLMQLALKQSEIISRQEAALNASKEIKTEIKEDNESMIIPEPKSKMAPS